MLEIFRLDTECEDRCIIGIIDDVLGREFLYDGNIIAEGKVTKFNFCPACGQELTIMTNKTENGVRFTKL